MQDQEAFSQLYRDNRDGEHARIHIHRPRWQMQAFAKLNEVRNSSWIVHLTCCNLACGGGPRWPKRVCSHKRYLARHHRFNATH